MGEKILYKTIKDIKELKIQGAERIAMAAVEAWRSAKDKKKASKLLLETRPTEPMLKNILKYLNTFNDPDGASFYISNGLEKIARFGSSLIKNNYIIYTHCHSSTVEAILEKAKKEGKKFEVHVTETRPNYQGRITATNLARNGIKVKYFVDSAAMLAIKDADLMLIGADLITHFGEVANKIGSGLFAMVANELNVPVYVASHSLKLDPNARYGKISRIEIRKSKEVWDKHPKNVKIVNPVFEFVKKSYITSIISEYGLVGPDFLVEKIKEEYAWLW
ncbi:MAG: translation initiation factor eIF-2B [Candidatus Micrarchaeia archaeon]|jgi:ribose 1,5-bisphosphate isomerase